jgi:hypothetical protein
MNPNPTCSSLLALAGQVLALAAGDDPASVTLGNETITVLITRKAGAGLPRPAEAAGLKTIHRRLLKKAAELGEPVKARKLIQAAGYTLNSNSRAALTLLVQSGLLRRDFFNRYHLPGPNGTPQGPAT